jgi:hypothetical protein
LSKVLRGIKALLPLQPRSETGVNNTPRSTPKKFEKFFSKNLQGIEK